MSVDENALALLRCIFYNVVAFVVHSGESCFDVDSTGWHWPRICLLCPCRKGFHGQNVVMSVDENTLALLRFLFYNVVTLFCPLWRKLIRRRSDGVALAALFACYVPAARGAMASHIRAPAPMQDSNVPRPAGDAVLRWSQKGRSRICCPLGRTLIRRRFDGVALAALFPCYVSAGKEAMASHIRAPPPDARFKCRSACWRRSLALVANRRQVTLVTCDE
jgi:hypothetical protein